MGRFQIDLVIACWNQDALIANRVEKGCCFKPINWPAPTDCEMAFTDRATRPEPAASTRFISFTAWFNSMPKVELYNLPIINHAIYFIAGHDQLQALNIYRP